MRFIFKPVFIASILVGFLFSCGNDNGNFRMTDFEEVIVSRDVPLTGDTDSPRCKISIQLYVAKGDSGKSQSINSTIEDKLFDFDNLPLKQAADSFANVYARNYIDVLRPLYKKDRSDKTRQSWYEYRYNVSTEVSKGRDDIIVYTIKSEWYEGGAHGLSQKHVVNFDVNTGKRLAASDVFVPGYETKLTEILLKSLKDKVGAKTITELHDKGYLYSMDMFVPENFIIGEDHITFIYNVYEIAPFAEGMTELSIDYSELKDILPK